MTSIHPAIAEATRSGLRAVQMTAEFMRINALPRRTHVELFPELLHEALRLPGSKMELQPLQVWALQEAFLYRGLVAPLPVGCGKTGVSFLIPTMVNAQRPLILVPGSVLNRKTLQVDLPLWSKNFRVHENLRFMSYEKLSRDSAANFLDVYQPDHIIADEAQRLKDTKSAAHRRLARYIEDHPEARFYPLSGTLMSRSLRQGYLLFWWALREKSPLPHSWMEIQNWADAIDEKIAFDESLRPMPGPLLKFCEKHETLRQGFERRLQETGGYVFALDAEVKAALRIEQIDIPVPPAVEEAFEMLRGWYLPNGDVIVTALELARHAVELIYGLYYVWVWPEGFTDEQKKLWLHARREYRSYARHVCRYLKVDGQHFDTEWQVREACRLGVLDAIYSSDREKIKPVNVYEQWIRVCTDVEPKTTPVWISEYMLDYVEKWLKKPQSLAWVNNKAFLEKLRERGVLCFGAGEDEIDLEAISKTPRSCALSFDAHCTGRNLQGNKELDAPGYYRNLFLAFSGSGERDEQAIGRTHRQGQEADEVECYLPLLCREMWNLFQSAMLDAKNVYREGQGQRQKLIFGDVSVETEEEVDAKKGPLWVQTKPPDKD